MSCPESIARLQPLAGILLAASLPAAASLGAERQVNPRIELGYTADDNYRLDFPGNEIEVSGGRLLAQLQLRRLGPIHEFTFTPRLRATYFPDEPHEDSNDYFLALRYRRNGLRSGTDLALRLAEETVVSSELPGSDPLGEPPPDLGGPSGPDAGRVSVRNRRQLAEFVPEYQYQFSERKGLELRARYLYVNFDELENEQVGYQQADAGIGWMLQQTERTQLILRGTVSRYEPELDFNDAFGYGGQLEWRRRTSERSNAYLRLGMQRTEIERIAGGQRTTRLNNDYLAGIGASLQGQVTDFFIDLSRNIGPTAAGFVVSRDQLRMQWTRRFTPKLNGFVGLRGLRDEAVDETVNYARRLYANGSVGLEWRMNRPLSLAITYDHTWQEFDDEPDERRSHGAFLSFIYEPNRAE